MKILPLATLAVATLALPGLAQAQCAMADPVVTPQIRVDPLDASGPSELVQHFALTFRRTGTEAAAPLVVRYQIVDEDSSVQSRVGRSLGPTVEWRSPGSSRDIGALRSEAYSLLRSGVARMGAEVAAVQSSVALSLTNLRADLPAGVYREQFTVRYWCGEDDGSAPYEAQGLVSVAVSVPNILSANVAGASLRGEIDFLNFAMLQRNLQVSVRSTGPYQVTARSLNGGELHRARSGRRDEADRIRYAATFGGRSLNLEGGAAQTMPRAGLAGRQIPLEVEVEDVGGKRAGLYADTLMLTLAPAN